MVKSNKSKMALTFVIISLVAALLIGVIVMINNSKTTETLSPIDYKIGILDVDGEFEKSDNAIVSKKFNTVDGLKIEFEEEDEVTVMVFFYDEDEKFVSATEELSSEYTYSEIEGVKYFKVVITPVDDNDITLSEKSDYVKQVTVTFNK